MKQIIWNRCDDGCARTILAGYHKYGVDTVLGVSFGTGGTCIVEVYEETCDEMPG